MRLLLLFFILTLTIIEVYAQRGGECYSKVTDDYAVAICITSSNLKSFISSEGFYWDLPGTGDDYDAVTYRGINGNGQIVCSIFFQDFITVSTVVHEVTHCTALIEEEEKAAAVAGELSEEVINIFFDTRQQVYNMYVAESDTSYLALFDFNK